MSVKVPENQPEDNSDHKESARSPIDGDLSGVEESSELDQVDGDIQSSAETDQETGSSSGDSHHSMEADEEETEYPDGGLAENDLDSKIDEAGSTSSRAQNDDPQISESIGSHEFYSTYTARGWYNPEGTDQPDSAVLPAKTEQNEEPITGDTQPVTISAQPSQPSIYPVPPDISTPDADIQSSSPSQIDVNATRVASTAYVGSQISQTREGGVGSRANQRYSQPQQVGAVPPRSGSFDFQRGAGCLLRISIFGLFMMVIAGLIGISVLLFQYYRIAATLPPVDDLREKAAQFETTRIFDRNGNILYEILDPTAGRRSYVSLDNMSPYLVAAIVATEDKGFYSHPGFDATAIGRAFLQNYQGGETISGASTITQQLARMLLFSPEERSEITYMRKVREAILAAEITRRYTKDEILELYINDVYFGNLAYGVEAAAQTYFGKSADKLTLAQAAFLGGLIQAPSVYDVYTNRDVTLNRLEQVLFLMYEASQEQGCIFVSNSPHKICVDALTVADATNEMAEYEFNSPGIEIRYPHWVTYIRSLLETQFDAQTIYRSGFEVHTTLDPALQDLAEQVVEKQVTALADRKASNGALVAMRPNTGEILAMVGSADFYNEEIDGQVNMAVSPRQPGSSIKPLTYIAAFEKGWTPATLIWDVPSEFPPSGDPNDTRPPYKPVNYDDRFHGPVTVRSALANSYNVPAVKTLDYVGIYDNLDT
ncbi:MAG: transglycosylase domain-containing protein, partial [Chloroflexota bacterium]